MRFNRFVVLPLAVLALGVMPACSGDDGDDNDNPDSGTSADAGTGGQTDSGTFGFPDAGTDPGTSPSGTCPSGALICESFDQGLNGWEPSGENAAIQASNGRLHVVTEDGHNEDTTFGAQAIARWAKTIPAFQTQLFVRAHVYMDSLPKVFGQMGTFFVLSNLEDGDFGGIELQVISDTGFALDDWSLREGQGWNRQELPIGVGMAAGRWVCLEWEVRRDTPTSTHGTARVYRDGALAYEFQGIGMRNFKNFTVGYGFVHPKGQSGSETFYDNVVVSSTARIGCE